MSKYDPLRDYLLVLPAAVDDKTLSFGEIERILRSDLPRSARKHRAWWSNPSSPTDHPYAQAWLGTGWEVDTVSLTGQWVRFTRTASRGSG